MLIRLLSSGMLDDAAAVLVLTTVVLIFAGIPWLLKAIALYRISRTLGLHRPWLAFIPVVQDYALGRIPECVPGPGRPMRWGRILLGLRLTLMCCSLLTAGNYIWAALDSGDGTDAWYYFWNEGFDTLRCTHAVPVSENTEIAILAVFMILSYIMQVIEVVYHVFYFIVLYKIYSMFSRSPVLLLVVSILFRFLDFIFIFSLRNRTPYWHTCYPYSPVPPPGGYPAAYHYGGPFPGAPGVGWCPPDAYSSGNPYHAAPSSYGNPPSPHSSGDTSGTQPSGARSSDFDSTPPHQ